MILNLLPALRDLRTPLATGYVLILAIYLTFGEQFERLRDNTDVGQRAAEAVEILGQAGSLALVTFIAFLVGTLWSDVIPALTRRVAWFLIVHPLQQRKVRKLAKDYRLDAMAEYSNNLPTWNESRYFTKQYRPQIEQLVKRRLLATVNSSAQLREAARARLYRTEVTWVSDAEFEADDDVVLRVFDVRRHAVEVVDGTHSIHSRLLGKEPEIWNTWDRLRSEAEFRSSVSTSLIALSVPIIEVGSPLWLLLLVPISAILFAQGELKFRRAFSTLFESLVSGRVSMHELEKLDDPDQVYLARGRKEHVSNGRSRLTAEKVAEKSDTTEDVTDISEATEANQLAPKGIPDSNVSAAARDGGRASG